MKTKLISLILFFSCVNILAQKTDSTLWVSFQENLEQIIHIQKENSLNLNGKNNKQYDKAKFMSLLMDYTVTQKGLDYLAFNYGGDSIQLIRDFALSIFSEIADKSTDSAIRTKAINYLLDYSLYPSISGFLLTDFDDEAKKKVMRIFTKQYSEEELNFYAISYVRNDTVQSNSSFRWRIQNYIQQQNENKKKKTKRDKIKKVTYQEASEILFQSDVSKYKENIFNFPVYIKDLFYLQRIILNIGQLNIQEAIPYLKECVNSDKYNEKIRQYAVFALATMRVEDYEDKAVEYFSIDTHLTDTGLARIINSQKIWYAYIHRLKSEKYQWKCPVAYETIRNLAYVLKDFPTTDRPFIERWIELDGGNMFPILSEVKPVFIVPDECGESTQTEKTPINPEHIKVVVDWMEANKGKYELQSKRSRTF